MFKTCIHCCRPLGDNELIEHFPVGEKLAFDSERGRLWVICTHCARWNLTPLEERWEALEECERQFRGQRLRAQTSNIGYAVAGNGVGLVRIGRPLRPEFAAWRYGREFSRRRTRLIVGLGGGAAVAAGVIAGSATLGVGLLMPPAIIAIFAAIGIATSPPILIEIPRGGPRSWSVSTGQTMILPDDDGGWQLSIRHHFGRATFKGAEARRLLAVLLTHLNRSGASDGLIRKATEEVERIPVENLLTQFADWSGDLWKVDEPLIRGYYESLNRTTLVEMKGDPPPVNRAGIAHMEAVHRLAIEMALHETTEQRAIDGDLAELEAAWREADEVAGIADKLLLPPGVDEFIANHPTPPRKT